MNDYDGDVINCIICGEIHPPGFCEGSIEKVREELKEVIECEKDHTYEKKVFSSIYISAVKRCLDEIERLEFKISECIDCCREYIYPSVEGCPYCKIEALTKENAKLIEENDRLTKEDVKLFNKMKLTIESLTKKIENYDNALLLKQDMGKTYLQLTGFILAVKQGKRAIIFAPEYVVMDRGSYDHLNRTICEHEWERHNEYVEQIVVGYVEVCSKCNALRSRIDE